MNKDLSLSLGLSPCVLASFDDDDVIVWVARAAVMKW